jgi:hypothetical protein
MDALTKHIEELDQLMKTKGYDGYFLAAGGYPGKLKESLTAFADSFFRGAEYGLQFPPALTTYCYWRDDRSDTVQCRFSLDYHATKGFRIKEVELQKQDRYGFTVKQETIPVLKLTDVPSLIQGKAWGLEPDKQVNRKSKGLKF